MAHVPPIFISHGTPALAVDGERGAELARWAGDLPRPRGILVFSAHWAEKVLTRGSTAKSPGLRYDFGHPDEALFRVQYPAPGAPDLAYEVHAITVVERAPDRGWDHGVWTPLMHMYPAADIPILQLSLVEGATPRHLFSIGRKIGALAARGILIVGSGGITHNPGELDARRDAPVVDWAREFDAWVANQLADAAVDDLVRWRAKGPRASLAHPTPEHLAPLFVVAGAASLYDHAVGYPLRGFEHGTLSRRCVQFGR